MRRLQRCAISCVILTALAFAFSASLAIASPEMRSEELLSALRDGNFSAATAHFDNEMKTGLSPEALSHSWNAATNGYGRVIGWKLTQSMDDGENHLRIYTVDFEHGQNFK